MAKFRMKTVGSLLSAMMLASLLYGCGGGGGGDSADGDAVTLTILNNWNGSSGPDTDTTPVTKAIEEKNGDQNQDRLYERQRGGEGQPDFRDAGFTRHLYRTRMGRRIGRDHQSRQGRTIGGSDRQNRQVPEPRQGDRQGKRSAGALRKSDRRHRRQKIHAVPEPSGDGG